MNNDLDSIMNEMFGQMPDKYPLTDLAQDTKTNRLFIEIALAGVKKENIDIETEHNMLIISGSMEKDLQEDIEIIRSDIARRDFVRKIRLSPGYLGGKIDASYEDGLLCLTVHPAKDFTKKISIS